MDRLTVGSSLGLKNSGVTILRILEFAPCHSGEVIISTSHHVFLVPFTMHSGVFSAISLKMGLATCLALIMRYEQSDAISSGLKH